MLRGAGRAIVLGPEKSWEKAYEVVTSGEIATVGADIPADAGHRGYILSRRPSRNENDQREHECRTYRQHRQ
jgi:hypothetical protein